MFGKISFKKAGCILSSPTALDLICKILFRTSDWLTQWNENRSSLQLEVLCVCVCYYIRRDYFEGDKMDIDEKNSKFTFTCKHSPYMLSMRRRNREDDLV